MYHLKNVSVDIVTKLVDEQIPEAGMCCCDKCRLDVMALALNHLPPTYVVTDIGELFAAIDATYQQHQTDALSAVINAIRTVRGAPRHDTENKPTWIP